MSTLTTITTMQSIANHNGGKCLSKEYKDEHTPLEWICEKGHRWESPYKVVNQGGWCMQCLKKQKWSKDRLEEMKALAVSKGGKCLSTEYKDLNTKMDWECAEGHKWNVAPIAMVHGGTWCRKCGYKRNGEKLRGNIEDILQIALKHGGKCLSEKYGTGKEKLYLECSEGHRWWSTPSMTRSGRWCKKCAYKQAGINQRTPISVYNKIAKGHGGKLLSQVNLGNKVKMLWECKAGHQWYAVPNTITNGSWCQKCGYKITADKKRDTIDTFHKIAKEKGGKCLSTVYTTNEAKLEFQCKEGHRFKSMPVTVKHAGGWCPKCGHKSAGDKMRSTLDAYINIAIERGGKCLSTVFTNNKANLEWECALGHRWAGGAKNVLHNGAWCPVCARKTVAGKLKDSIETYREIATKHGGKCLSNEYVNQKIKLEFECAEGHRWKAAPTSIKNGGCWCRICNYHGKRKN